MTKWMHKCRLSWLRARQQYLTASDVKDLLPVTKTGRPRKITEMDYLKVLARKEVMLTEDDCISVGAAARGHILEPYAIQLLNAISRASWLTLYHWDDAIVVKPGRRLAFSPDAMSARQVSSASMVNVETISGESITIAEVKSYSPEKHFICGHTKKEDLEERWQIATAMALDKRIDTAYLLFYNPSMVDQRLYVIKYKRNDLVDEIATVLMVEHNWDEFIDKKIVTYGNIFQHPFYTGQYEEDIIAKIKKEDKLNPRDHRLVE